LSHVHTRLDVLALHDTGDKTTSESVAAHSYVSIEYCLSSKGQLTQHRWCH
jgi:hypothetical protein